jgi:hypothetical protein
MKPEELTARDLMRRTLDEDVQAVTIIDDEQLKHWLDCIAQVAEDVQLCIVGADAWMLPRLQRMERNVTEVRRAMTGALAA